MISNDLQALYEMGDLSMSVPVPELVTVCVPETAEVLAH